MSGHLRESGPYPIFAQNRVEDLEVGFDGRGDLFDPRLILRVNAEFGMAHQTVGEPLHPPGDGGQLAQQPAPLG